MCFFLQSYSQFTARYRNLFGKGKPKSDGDSDEVDERTDEEKHLDYWGWYVTLDKLAKGDRSKWDFYLNMNVVAFLNYLSFVKDRNKWQQ